MPSEDTEAIRIRVIDQSVVARIFTKAFSNAQGNSGGWPNSHPSSEMRDLLNGTVMSFKSKHSSMVNLGKTHVIYSTKVNQRDGQQALTWGSNLDVNGPGDKSNWFKFFYINHGGNPGLRMQPYKDKNSFLGVRTPWTWYTSRFVKYNANGGNGEKGFHGTVHPWTRIRFRHYKPPGNNKSHAGYITIGNVDHDGENLGQHGYNKGAIPSVAGRQDLLFTVHKMNPKLTSEYVKEIVLKLNADQDYQSEFRESCCRQRWGKDVANPFELAIVGDKVLVSTGSEEERKAIVTNNMGQGRLRIRYEPRSGATLTNVKASGTGYDTFAEVKVACLQVEKVKGFFKRQDHNPATNSRDGQGTKYFIMVESSPGEVGFNKQFAFKKPNYSVEEVWEYDTKTQKITKDDYHISIMADTIAGVDMGRPICTRGGLYDEDTYYMNQSLCDGPIRNYCIRKSEEPDWDRKFDPICGCVTHTGEADDKEIRLKKVNPELVKELNQMNPNRDLRFQMKNNPQCFIQACKGTSAYKFSDQANEKGVTADACPPISICTQVMAGTSGADVNSNNQTMNCIQESSMQNTSNSTSSYSSGDGSGGSGGSRKKPNSNRTDDSGDSGGSDESGGMSVSEILLYIIGVIVAICFLCAIGAILYNWSAVYDWLVSGTLHHRKPL